MLGLLLALLDSEALTCDCCATVKSASSDCLYSGLPADPSIFFFWRSRDLSSGSTIRAVSDLEAFTRAPETN